MPFTQLKTILPLAAAALALAAGLLSAPRPALAQGPLAAQPAPELSGTDMLSGESKTLSSYAGKWVLLDFWATWCAPCIAKMPELLSASAPYRQDGRLSLVTLSADRPETLEQLKAFIQQNQVDYPVLLPASEVDAARLELWDLSLIPATYLINPQGQVVARDLQFERLDAVLGFYLDAERPLLGLSSDYDISADGSVRITADVQSRGGKALPDELRLTLNLAWDEWVYDLEGADPSKVVDVNEHVEPDYEVATLKPGSNGKASHTFTLPAGMPIGAFYYGLALDVPGSEGLGADGSSPLKIWDDSEYVTVVEPVFAEDEEEMDEPAIEPAMGPAEDDAPEDGPLVDPENPRAAPPAGRG